jgi:hypothetical protein
MGFTDEEERRFMEIGMRVYLALGLPRSTSKADAMKAIDEAMDGKLLAHGEGE